MPKIVFGSAPGKFFIQPDSQIFEYRQALGLAELTPLFRREVLALAFYAVKVAIVVESDIGFARLFFPIFVFAIAAGNRLGLDKIPTHVGSVVAKST